ncbi:MULTISPECIES: hypothetical protein [unclassified Roseofilum]|uniref:hypothetical protein n=1 Tax=unclassified Roseofilum TaxID=2620099 RepID=UPI001B258DCC|nr:MULTISPECIES: hypothetical protein [unclassified Roseofilum]MBP0010503.1 hypothetical protein [Roseofilum sp. Belize Diploria]MBP0012023.1 hypothetical protein [Roseofilum sp. SID3]
MLQILTLGIIDQGVAMPVLWWILEKKGNSNSDQRMRWLEAFHRLFPEAEIAFICGDRELIGQAWVRYLL